MSAEKATQKCWTTLAVALAVVLLVLPACAGNTDATANTDATTEADATSEASVDVPLEPEPDAVDDVDAAIADSRGTVVDATEDNVRLISRTYRADGVTWLPQSGSALEFNVVATRLDIEIVADDSVDKEESHRPRYAVLVDGEVLVDEIMDEHSRTVEVLNSPDSVHAVIEVIHLSEAREGSVGVRSIAVESDEQNPVNPTEGESLSIEFVGDSITCGYGVESASANDSFMTATENFMKSYAYLTAKELDADYSSLCYSGYGIVSGWTSNGEKDAERLLPPLYDLVVSGSNELWDFGAHPHDVVVVNLGTNDFSYTGTDDWRMSEFATGYADFLDHVRARNPESFIICTYGMMGGEELYPYLEQAVEDHVSRTGDTRIMSYCSEPIDVEQDGVGANWHPNTITQQKNAATLVEVIKGVLEREE